MTENFTEKDEQVNAEELVAQLQKIDPTKVHSIMAIVILNSDEQNPNHKRAECYIGGDEYDIRKMATILVESAQASLQDRDHNTERTH